MTNQTATIAARDATLNFGDGAGVFGLNFTVPSGSILGMIGPSGSGKTTAVRLMTGLSHPSSGQIRVFGGDPTTFKPRQREQFGYLPQHFVLYPNLTVEENIGFVASLYGLSRRERRRRITELLEFVELSDSRRKLGSQLSGGMQRRLMLASSLTHQPQLLFADEPTAGIDPVLRGKFWEYFRQLRDAGHTLVITTQYVGEAAFCDQVAVMRQGRLLAVEPPEQLRKRTMGGEIILLNVDPDHVSATLRVLRAHPEVREVRTIGNAVNAFSVRVAEFAESMPLILKDLQDANVTVNSVEKDLPDYDEVFVRLMEQTDQAEAQSAPKTLERAA